MRGKKRRSQDRTGHKSKYSKDKWGFVAKEQVGEEW